MRKTVSLLISLGIMQAAFAAQAQTATRSLHPRAHAVVIQNCVGADKVSFRPGRDGAMLDLEDRVHVAAAIVARYPMMERDGLYPSDVALWRRPEGDWVYATLVAKEAAPFPSCFTSNVSAAGIKFTPALLKKYFGITSEPL